MADDKKKTTAYAINNSFWFERVVANSINTYGDRYIVGGLGVMQLQGNGGGGLNRVITVVIGEAAEWRLRIWFFRRGGLSDFVDGDVAVFTVNDLIKSAGYVDIESVDYETYGNFRYAQVRGLQVDYSCPNGKMYYYVESKGVQAMTKANNVFVNFGQWLD